MDYLTDKMRNLTKHVKSQLLDEATRQIRNVGNAAFKAAEDITVALQVRPPSPYHDALMHGMPGVSPPHSSTFLPQQLSHLTPLSPPSPDPRVIAHEGIKVHQILIGFPADSPVHGVNSAKVLQECNKALAKVKSPDVNNRLHSMERLTNRGLLGEFLMGEGMEWFKEADNLDNFLAV